MSKHGHHGHLGNHAIPEHIKEHTSGLHSAKPNDSSLNLVGLCQDAAKKAQPWVDGVRTNAQDFGEGLCYGMIQSPIDGSTQLVNHVRQLLSTPPFPATEHPADRAGHPSNNSFQQWKPPQLVPTPHHPDHGATRFGEAAGSFVDAVVIFKGAGLIGDAVAGAAGASASPATFTSMYGRFGTQMTGAAAGFANGTLGAVPEKDGYWSNKAAFTGVCALGGANVTLGRSCFNKAMQLFR